MTGLPEIHLSALAYTAGHWLVRPQREDHFDLSAPYQRGSVWTEDQRRALIQSLYMGLPVGAVIIAELPYREGSPYSYRVIDGKQRIEAVRAFAADQFTIPAAWLRDDDLPDVPVPDDAQLRCSQLRRLRLSMEMHWQMPALQFDSQREWLGHDANGRGRWRTRNDEEMIRAEAEVYGLINSGGTPQTEQDLARARELTR